MGKGRISVPQELCKKEAIGLCWEGWSDDGEGSLFPISSPASCLSVCLPIVSETGGGGGGGTGDSRKTDAGGQVRDNSVCFTDMKGSH